MSSSDRAAAPSAPSAPATDTGTGGSAPLDAAVREICARAAAGRLDDASMQQLFGALVPAYAARATDGLVPPIARREEVAATDIMVLASAMLKVADVQLFEFGMWQTFSGIRSH